MNLPDRDESNPQLEVGNQAPNSTVHTNSPVSNTTEIPDELTKQERALLAVVLVVDGALFLAFYFIFFPKTVFAEISALVGLAWIGFLNDVFYDRSYIAGLGELSISVCA